MSFVDFVILEIFSGASIELANELLENFLNETVLSRPLDNLEYLIYDFMRKLFLKEFLRFISPRIMRLLGFVDFVILEILLMDNIELANELHMNFLNEIVLSRPLDDLEY